MAANKAQEAQEHVKAAEKYLKTTLLRWKPDYDNAADEYTQAAQCFRIARDPDASKECYLKASDCYKKSNAIFHAGKSLDNAMLAVKEKAPPEELYKLAMEAASLYQQHGSVDSAAVVMERAGRVMDRSAPHLAVQLYIQAADVTLGDRTQGCEYLAKASRLLVRLKRYEEAVDCVRREICHHREADDVGAVGRLTVVLVLIQLARGDIVAAEKVFRELGNNCESTEVQTIEQLLQAFDNEDEEAARRALSSPFIRSMDIDYANLASVVPLPKATAPILNPGVRANAAPSYFYSNPVAGNSNQIEESPYEVVTLNKKPKEIMKESNLDEITKDTELC